MRPVVKQALNLIQKLGAERVLLHLSRLPVLRTSASAFAWQSQSFDHCLVIYTRFAQRLERNSVTLDDKDILEIGAGNSIGIGYFFARHGFKSWTASDPFVSFATSPRAAQREFKLATRVAEEHDADVAKLVRLKDGKLVLEPRLRFLRLDITSFSSELEGKFDIIFSNSVLEHLSPQQLDVATDTFKRALRANGVMVHGIDLKDHINPLNPLGFYRYGDHAWSAMTKGSIFYVNRLRSSDYVDYFKRHHFTVVDCDPYLRFALPPKIHSDLRARYSDEDLCFGQVYVTARKPVV